MKVADPTNSQTTLDGQPSPVPIAKPVSPTPTPLPLAGSPQMSPTVDPRYGTPLSSPAPVAPPASDPAASEQAYQQATNPALQAPPAPSPVPLASPLPSIGNADETPPSGGLPLPPSMAPSPPPPILQQAATSGPADGGMAALPLAPSAPVDATPSIPAPSALDAAPPPVAPPVAPAMEAAAPPPLIPLATSTLPSGVPISNQDLTGATISGAPAPTPIEPTAQTNFANDLTGQTLGVGQTPDRLALAQSMFDTFQKQSDPAYQAAVREAESNGAALGQLGSGGLRTSVGNLAAQRNLALEGERENLTNSALTGSIDDAYKNVGINQQQQGFQAGQKADAFGQQAQQQAVQTANNQYNTGVAQQQQGFQAGQQGTAFNQAAQQAQIQEALTNGDFNRALALYNAGNQNSPNLALAADYTGQAQGAGAAASGLVQNAVGNANTQIPSWLLPYLQQQNGATPNANIPLAIPNPTGTPVSQPQVG